MLFHNANLQLQSLMSEQLAMVTFDKLRKFIVQCNNPQNTKSREQLINQFYSNDKFLLMLETLIMTLNNLQEKQHCANMINIIFCNRMEFDPSPMHFRRIFTFFTKYLLDFEFPADVKKLFSKSFSQSFTSWQEEIQGFWEDVVEALIDLLELAGNGSNSTQQYFCKKINTICLSQPFPVILPRAFKVDEVYLTIIFFFTLFFDEFRVRDSTYQQRGMKMLKKVQSQIFNTDFIISKSRVIQRFLEFEESFFYQITQLKQLKTAAFFVSNWSELLVHLQVVLLTSAMPFQKKANCYNFFLLSEDWSQTRFLQLKRSAFDIMNYIITISESLGDTSEEMQSIATLDLLSDSVYYSLLWMVKQNRSPRDSEVDLELALLRNFYLFISIFHPNLEQRKSIMKDLIFPIILQEINQAKTLFQDYQEETDYLADCLYSDNRLQSRLALASKLLQQILDDERDFGTYIRTYMFAILAAKLNIGVNLQVGHEEEAKKWPMQVCFFVLTVLDIQTRTQYLEQKAFGALLTQSAFMALSMRQKKYIYFYLAHTCEHYFGPNDSDVLFVNYIFSPQCKVEEEYFALDLIFEICNNYYNDDFVLKFLRYFPNFRNQQLALQVANKLFVNYLHRINEYIICIFVNFCCEKAKKMTNELLLQLQRNKQYPSNTYTITSYLNVCHGIAKDTSYVKGKPDLIQCLVEAFRLTPKMAKISAEESAIHIGTELLRALKRFPDRFIPIILKVIDYFKSSEYNGIAFYEFFAECMETISTYPYDQQMGKLVCELQQAFAQAYAYYVYYPEQIADDQKKHLGEAQVLLLNILIYFGDKIKQKMITEAKNISHQMLKVEVYSNETMLVLRTNIMLLLCEILTTKNYPINHIYTAIKGKLFLSNADSKLLIFLLNQIRPELQPPDQFLLAAIVLELLNSSQRFKLSRDLPFKESFKKYTSIFSYITLPVDACVSEVEQASQFFKTYKAEDSATCSLVIRQIQFGDDHKHLWPFLQKVLTLKQKDFINLGLFDPNQPIFGSEEEKTKSPPPNEAPSSKRKIMKIVGEKDANGNTQIFYAHSNLKRNTLSAAQTHKEDSEDDQMLDLNGKRRKINQQTSAEKISKRVLMREKQSKKVVRI